MVGIDISGWVEVWNDGARTWEAAIKVDTIVRRDNRMYALVFGIQRLDSDPPAIAAGRGMPADASREAREYDPAQAPHDSNFGHTWILWSELETTLRLLTTDASKNVSLRGGWNLLFDLMARLADDYTAEHVRLTVWFF